MLNLVQLEITPFDLPTPKTLAWNQTRSGWDAPPLNYMYTVTLKLGFGVTQGHRKRHCSIEHIRLYIRLP